MKSHIFAGKLVVKIRELIHTTPTVSNSVLWVWFAKWGIFPTPHPHSPLGGCCVVGNPWCVTVYQFAKTDDQKPTRGNIRVTQLTVTREK